MSNNRRKYYILNVDNDREVKQYNSNLKMNETLEMTYASIRSTGNPGGSLGNSPLDMDASTTVDKNNLKSNQAGYSGKKQTHLLGVPAPKSSENNLSLRLNF